MWMSLPIFLAIHPLIEIFHSGPKWWSNWLTTFLKTNKQTPNIEHNIGSKVNVMFTQMIGYMGQCGLWGKLFLLASLVTSVPESQTGLMRRLSSPREIRWGQSLSLVLSDVTKLRFFLFDLIYLIVSKNAINMKRHLIQSRIKTQWSPGLISIVVLNTHQDKTRYSMT